MDLIKEYGVWAEFWLVWWRPWEEEDVNRERVIWMKWSWVPLYAWSERFFRLGSASFGKVMEVHEVTQKKKRLDEAYVNILTSLHSIDRVIQCMIDGGRYEIHIEEVRCLENEVLQEGVS